MSEPQNHRRPSAVMMERQRRVQPVRRAGDLMLLAVGLVAALGSASFAGYMITADNSNPRFMGAEHLMLFAQPVRTMAVPPLRVARQAPADPGVDYQPVGSIPVQTNPRVASSRRQMETGGYTLREAQDGVAIVDGPHGSYRIIDGATLPGAGKVHTIEFRDGQWRVVTDSGIITAAR